MSTFHAGIEDRCIPWNTEKWKPLDFYNSIPFNRKDWRGINTQFHTQTASIIALKFKSYFRIPISYNDFYNAKLHVSYASDKCNITRYINMDN